MASSAENVTSMMHTFRVRRDDHRRTRSGCFNCRKIKKKCDETRPACGYCSAKCIPCVWPRGNQSLPKGYVVPPVDEALVRKRREEQRARGVDGHEPAELADDSSSSDDDDTYPLVIEQVINFDDVDGNEADRDAGQHEVVELEVEKLPVVLAHESLPLWTPIEESMTDTFISVGAGAFIAALAPQYTHPLLKTENTWTPLVNKHPIMLQVAESCGCAFLSSCKSGLDPIAEVKFSNTMDALIMYMAQADLCADDHLWIGAAFQLMSIGATRVRTFNPHHLMLCLQYSYMLIENKYITEKPVLMIEGGPDSPPKPGELDVDYETDAQIMDLENSIACSVDVSLTTRFERGFLESFIYGYGMCILTGTDHAIQGLPGPFELFYHLRKVLKHSLVPCDVSWMNHPVFGSSFDAFEMAIKASYLLRNQSDPESLPMAKKLLLSAYQYPKPSIAGEAHVNKSKLSALRDSVLLTEAFLKCVKILLKKIIDPNFDLSNDSVQRDVTTARIKLSQIDKDSGVRSISPMCLLIIGLSALYYEDREVILENIFGYSDIVRARYTFSIIDVLEIAWGYRGDLYSTARGLDVLMDDKVMQLLVF